MNRRRFVKNTVAGLAGLTAPRLGSQLSSAKGTPPQTRVNGPRIVLENSLVRRVLEKENDVWRTRTFSRADGTDEVPLQSDEFQVLLLDGARLKIDDYHVRGEPTIQTGPKEHSVRITYTPRGRVPLGGPRLIAVEYVLGDGPYLRKALVLEMEEGGAVDALEVERFKTVLTCDRGGFGQPIFIGNAWFVGLEYPGGWALRSGGAVSLVHYPGHAKKVSNERSAWRILSKTAVAGVGQRGDPLELAFHDYLETIRLPNPPTLQYDTELDRVGPPSESLPITPEYVMNFYNGIQSQLEPYGVKADTLVLESFGFDPQTIYRPRKDWFPQGYTPLRKWLEERGTRLGLWLPLNGERLRTKWGVQQGYEESNGPFPSAYGYFCLAGSRYNSALRESLKQIIRDGNIAYFKHDYQQMQCSAPGHGHLPTGRHGFEANLDATLDLMAFERELQPGLLMSATGYVWHSPWWLMHSNHVYFDYARDAAWFKMWPQLAPREWEMTYKDDIFFQKARKWRHLVPVSACLTQALYRGRRSNTGGKDETLREWSDAIMMIYGRGLQLMDPSLTASLIPADFWRALGEATRWWRANSQTLEKVVMIGGSPRQGQVHGYSHWAGDRGIVCLRNPDVREQAIRVPFDKSVLYRGKEGLPFRGRVIYPYVEDLATQFRSGEPILLGVPGYTVMIFELEPGLASPVTPTEIPMPIEGQGTVEAPYEVVYEGDNAVRELKFPKGGKVNVKVQVPDEEMNRCDLFLLARCNGKLPNLTRITLNGQPTQVRTAEGGDVPIDDREETSWMETEGGNWSIQSIDLRSLKGGSAEIVADLPVIEIAFTLEAWVIADRPVKPQPVPERILPPVFWHAFRRQTVRLLYHSIREIPSQGPWT
jgi:hypothetical protein